MLYFIVWVKFFLNKLIINEPSLYYIFHKYDVINIWFSLKYMYKYIYTYIYYAVYNIFMYKLCINIYVCYLYNINWLFQYQEELRATFLYSLYFLEITVYLILYIPYIYLFSPNPEFSNNSVSFFLSYT